MKPRGRRIAIAAVVLGLATAAVTAFLLRERIVEEWHIHRLKKGDEESKKEALEWMAEHGGEASWLVVVELSSRLQFERPHLGSLGWINRLGNALNKIGKFLGKRRLEVIITKVLEQKTRPPEELVLVAALVFFKWEGIQFEPRTYDLTFRRIREFLSDPDPLIRAGAASVLGNAGERARSLLPALEHLKNDPLPEVRQVAEEAIERLSAIPGAGDSPPR